MKKKATKANEIENSITQPSLDNSNATSLELKCACGKRYKKNSWYLRHIMTCTVHIHYSLGNSCDHPEVNCNTDAVLLDNLIELEYIDEIGEFIFHDDNGESLNLEREIENEENNFYANFCINIVESEID